MKVTYDIRDTFGDYRTIVGTSSTREMTDNGLLLVIKDGTMTVFCGLVASVRVSRQ